MLATLKFLVALANMFFVDITIKLYYCQKRWCLKFNSRKNNLHHQKARKKQYKTFKWSPQFFYEPLKAYFYTSAQGFCAILALFRSLKDQ